MRDPKAFHDALASIVVKMIPDDLSSGFIMDQNFRNSVCDTIKEVGEALARAEIRADEIAND